MQPIQSQTVFRFGRFCLDVGQRAVLTDGARIEIGARAFDLLHTLAARPGCVLSKAELLALAWPGVTVDENNLHVQISALRKVFGSDLIKTIPGRGYQFTVAVNDPAGAVRKAPVAAHHLVGRSGELEALATLTLNHRIVTIMGPAGVGKTALARTFSAMDPAHAARNTCFVELAPLSDGARLAEAVAAALGLKPAPGPITPQIASHLGDNPCLLVLDNCEHLRSAVAAWMSDITPLATQLQVLATSQVRLGLPKEHVFKLEPLATPNDVTLYQVEQSPAATLFVLRAAHAVQGFQLTQTNAATINDICCRLDGNPLALELAAARVGLLGVEGVCARLDQRLKLLTKGKDGAAARHLTLQAALSWSYELLNVHEQFVFRSLSVFRGGFTAAQVQAVAVSETVDQWAALDAFSALLDRSLVAHKSQAVAAGEPQFMLLETMAEFASEKASEAGERDGVLARHAAHFTHLVVTFGGRRAGPHSRNNRDFSSLDPCHDNIRAAFNWSLTHDLAQAHTLADCLAVYWRMRGHLSEGRDRIDALLDKVRPESDRRALAQVLSSSCGILYELQDATTLAHRTEHAIALWTELDEPLEIGLASSWRAAAAYLMRDLEDAQLRYEGSLPFFRKGNDPGRIAETLSNIGNLMVERGHPQDAFGVLEEALIFHEAGGDLWGAAFCLEVIGLARFAIGDLDKCDIAWRASCDGFDSAGHVQRGAGMRLNRTALALRQQDVTTARTLLQSALDLIGDRPFTLEIVGALFLGAQFCTAIGAPLRAATLLACAQRWRQTWSLYLEEPVLFGASTRESVARETLSDADWIAAKNAGAVMTTQAALTLVADALAKPYGAAPRE
jgi:predicted ATPase